MDLEIKCSAYKCHSTMGIHDETYCADCYNEQGNQLEEFKKDNEVKEADIDSLKYTIEALELKIAELKEILKNCQTCSAILVAKNL